MDNLHAFPDRKAIEEEAVTWLIKLDSDKPLTSQENGEFQEWLSRSAVHRESINQLSQFWGNNVLTELMVPLGKSETQRGLWVGLLASWVNGWASSLTGSRAISATAAVTALAVSLMLVFGGQDITQSNGLYVTAVGQQKSIEMSDGSTLQLNTNSQVEVSYNNSYRNIRLIQGQVHFDVAKNPELPFRVYAGSGRVQAVGTAFTVYLKDKDVDVLVTEGRVALAALAPTQTPTLIPISTSFENTAADKNLYSRVDPYVNSAAKNLGELDAGEAVTMTLSQNQLDPQTNENTGSVLAPIKIISQEDLKRRQSWRNGLLVFSGEPLEYVVNEISRYTTVSIEITDPQVRLMEIGGRFRVGDVDGMFNALEANFGLHVNRLAYNRVQLSPAKEARP